MKAFKKFDTAVKHSNGEPVLRVGDLYISGLAALTEAEIINPDKYITGHITMRKLNELGNANHAKPVHPCRHEAKFSNVC